jgi:hypothetical protein
MALKDLRLALLAFARGWDGAKLHGTLLLLPSGDPTQPLFAGGGKPFAGTELALQVVAIGGTDAIAHTKASGQPGILPADLSHALQLFQQLALRFNPQDTSGGAGPPPTRARILKALPDSYLAQLPPGAARAASAATTADYACALRSRQPNFPPDPVPVRPVAWGEVLSFALRNPALARAMGLIRDFEVAANAADFAVGGWLFVTPGTVDDGTGLQVAWQAMPDAVKCYASLIPPVSAARDLFSAVLFPVSNPPLAPITPDEAQLDRAFVEALAYAEGFSRIVHVRQPDRADPETGTAATSVAPGSDTGIQIGWDDEQVSEWHNRQLGILLGPAPGGTPPLEAPLGVLGYRIDVRAVAPGEPPGSNAGWVSLMTASGAVPAAFAGLVPPFSGELVIEPAPTALFGAEEFWLPLYFAQWQGIQLGVRDDTARLLSGGIAAASIATGVSQSPNPSGFSGQGTPPRLLYGNTYQFRVRLADLTGQGRATADAPAQEAATQRAQITFARHVPPKSLAVRTTPPLPPDAKGPPGPVDTIDSTRPRIAYPEALFTPRYGSNADLAQAARQALLAQLGFDAAGTPPTTKPAANQQVATGLPDPDVKAVEIHVEVRVLAGDNADDVSSDGAFVTLYRTSRAFPSLPALPLPPPGTLLTPAQITVDVPLDPLTIAFADVTNVGDPAWSAGAGAGPLPMPRARDVRVTLTPIAEGPPGYFGTFADPARTPPTVGLTSKLLTRAPATSEPNLFAAPLDGSPALQAFSFRPVADGDVVAGIMQRLATQLGLRADGLMLFARPGERVVFGCSGALKHQIAPDGSRITFASAAELLAKWTLIYQAVLQRDWTWDGLKGRTLTARSLDATNNTIDIGTILVPRVANADALSGQLDRTRARIVFVHAIDPTAPNTVDGVLPRPPIWLHAMVEGSPADLEIASEQQAVRLPIVVPPAEMPEVVSAGYALAPYEIGAGYSTTAPRARQLWLEFAAPPPPGLAIVYRVLAYAPDPLLYHDDPLMSAPPPEDPALPLDPEYMRHVVPGQLPDEDGAEAMPPLIPSTDSPTRFLLPLPEGLAPAAPELHGLWSYEFRFGRVIEAMVKLGYKGPVLWCTAHGRHGRPLRLAGVQHPAPALAAAAQWQAPASLNLPPVLVTSTAYATPVRDGQIVGDGLPRTTVAFVLFAQVPQTDGSTFRNIQLGHAVAQPVPGTPGAAAVAQLQQADIIRVLDELALPRDAGLSVIGVEFLPPGGILEPFPRQHPGVLTDPLSPDAFGRQRILRTSPLVVVEPVCGVLEPAGADGH